MNPTTRILMIRHTEVCSSLKGICYGASDIPLSQDATAHMTSVCKRLERHLKSSAGPVRIVHSGLSRASRLALQIADTYQVDDLLEDRRIAEMNFGDWELKSWQSIFLSVGHRMSDMIHKPETYAPPGGETAHAVRDRVMDWYRNVPPNKSGDTETIIAVSHGGPIAALKGTLQGQSAREWPSLIPGYGEITDLSTLETP